MRKEKKKTGEKAVDVTALQKLTLWGTSKEHKTTKPIVRCISVTKGMCCAIRYVARKDGLFEMMFHPYCLDGSYLLSAGADGQVIIIELASNALEVVHTLSGHTKSILYVTFFAGCVLCFMVIV